MTQKAASYFEGKDMFLLPNGETYHLGAKSGEIPQRVLTVGSSARAERIASFLDSCSLKKQSNRGFSIFCGKYSGKEVAIISIGMGAPMMDFLIRELSFVQPKPLAVIRLGTCGLFNPSLNPGTIVTAGKGSLYCMKDYSYFYGNAMTKTKGSHPYLISDVVACDQKLNTLLMHKLKASKLPVHNGLNLSAETFYGAQGRRLEEFEDKNENFMEHVKKLNVDSVEMETHQLFDQAAARKTRCAVAAAAIGLLSRTADKPNVTHDELIRLEDEAGKACLAALAEFEL